MIYCGKFIVNNQIIHMPNSSAILKSELVWYYIIVVSRGWMDENYTADSLQDYFKVNTVN